MMVCTLIPSIILLVWNVPIGAKFFAYYLGGVGYAGQASNFAWANASIRDDDTLRALTLASMNLCSNLWFALSFSSLVPLSDAEHGSLTSFFDACTPTGTCGIAGSSSPPSPSQSSAPE